MSRQIARSLAALFVATYLIACCQHVALGNDDFLSVLNPATYRSASGQWSVLVDPANRDGSGKSTYRFETNGVEHRPIVLPFTLANAVVSSGGAILGYGYTNGRAGWNEPGEFFVAIIESDGSVRMKDVTLRKPSSSFHTAPDPIGEGIVYDEPNDRFVVRIRDPDHNRGHELWRTYRPSKATLVSSVRPAEKMKDSEVARAILDARPIPGTPLTLVHWWCYDRSLGKNDVGARFTLVDEDATPVWTLDLPGDYCVPGDEAAEDDLRRLVRQRGCILQHDQPSRFDVLLAAKKVRATYSVQMIADKFVVGLVEQTPHDFVSSARPKRLELPEVSLKALGSTTLEPARRAMESPVRDVDCFGFDGAGRICFLRRGPAKDQISFVIVDQTGKLLTEISLREDDREGSEWTGCAWVGGSRFLVTQSDDGLSAKSRAWWIDTSTNTRLAVSNFDCPAIERLVGFPDGAFAALVTERFKYTSAKSVIAFDRQGRRRWSLKDDYNNEGPDALFGVADIARTTRGELIVLENIPQKVKVFDQQGHKRQELDLNDLCKRELNYPTSIVGDSVGGFIVRDFQGSFPLIHVRRDGTIAAQLAPKYSDGRQVDEREGFQVDPSGKVWACEPDSLIRLSEDGRVDLVLGQAPQQDVLDKVAGLTIDRTGQFYVVDIRTGAIHLFDRAGKKLGVRPPRPTEFHERIAHVAITVSDRGSVFLGLGGGYISTFEARRFAHFAQDGSRLNDLMLPGGRCVSQPGTGNFVVLSGDQILLTDHAGATLRTILRRPNHEWLEDVREVDCALDGQIVATSNGVVDVFDVNGDPIRSVRLPEQVRFCRKVLYDGRHFLFFGETDIILLDEIGSPAGFVSFPALGHAAAGCIPSLTAVGEVMLFDRQKLTAYRFEIPR